MNWKLLIGLVFVSMLSCAPIYAGEEAELHDGEHFVCNQEEHDG